MTALSLATLDANSLQTLDIGSGFGLASMLEVTFIRFLMLPWARAGVQEKGLAKILLEKKLLTSVRFQTLLRSSSGVVKTGLDSMVKAASEILDADAAQKSFEEIDAPLKEMVGIWDGLGQLTDSQCVVMQKACDALAACTLAHSAMPSPSQVSAAESVGFMKDHIVQKAFEVTELYDRKTLWTDGGKMQELANVHVMLRAVNILLPGSAHSHLESVFGKISTL
eukprot:8467595-Karenia_brevis.AAC.1